MVGGIRAAPSNANLVFNCYTADKGATKDLPLEVGSPVWPVGRVPASVTQHTRTCVLLGFEGGTCVQRLPQVSDLAQCLTCFADVHGRRSTWGCCSAIVGPGPWCSGRSLLCKLP